MNNYKGKGKAISSWRWIPQFVDQSLPVALLLPGFRLENRFPVRFRWLPLLVVTALVIILPRRSLDETEKSKSLQHIGISSFGMPSQPISSINLPQYSYNTYQIKPEISSLKGKNIPM